ncbi:hypothetical protein A2331_02795 [Candidatus Falkowbacteria bacterium RIFOXYB2_FULL_34_18]|uniref:PDZ domain-containing protein n=1 Tax=Candidatus Falkowbacteria bacterium RIFOXYD2_FULL_34_120 TaxID=1798007 RepID=A0A1F5TML7_9BACT|nr:MAG: hypothetical protein A2331_02795 [Candidatus Falkowbacteria bacterium RIFOXYB2_FULL_34_18]OGF28361.1 MAG: hypothetical protein A2500_03145 [Candidatus Falkowbacteria bacterium RIFOXYC12_FULL_34_55]OGF37920.1 MAG: hypothetical protein A2466_05940 [Candidatus Falkowbacteria bacterium RIFOXYC2_FULL_34_220]OGF39638.1 MAG: hypothetical protein A2515_07235 [Candidatus Falkowbacteria bacterium RIFOXYD12_FULL_34_57]OGF40077.1 MAG: hypothetical protein A2531_04930 [Candidatus Falkowbacteria bact
MLKCFPFKADQTKNNNKYKMLENVKMKYFLITLLILSLGLNFFVFTYNRGAVADDLRFDEQEATVRAINSVMPAVVSITVYDWDYFEALDAPTGQKEMLKYKKQKIKGTGFLISSDGYIVTNRHVVSVVDEKSGEFRVILNSGKQYYAQLIAKDAFNDIAILKIFDKDLPCVKLGNSDKLPIGTSVIAIGNALGIYQNSVTKGIVSGLGRSLSASDQFGNSEILDNVIQTDAKINVGNSGGPLINLSGEVVGINTAIEQQGSSIGFAIPINDARNVIRSIIETGAIVRPMLGVRYVALTPEIALDNELPINYGAWVHSTDESPSVVADSPAKKGEIQDGDIIFEVNAIEIKNNNTLLSVIQKYKPGDKIGLKIQRGNKVIIKVVELGRM